MDNKDPDKYITVSEKQIKAEIKVKGSRFVSTVNYVKKRKDAENFYQEIKKKFHDATHNCFAYIISENEYRYSDDGEPSGTAGMPIYKVLKNENVFETIIIITRYFGGTKLGTGGLARAYTDAAIAGLAASKKTTKTRYTTIGLEITYEQYNELLRFINQFNGNFVKSDYKEKIELELQIPQSRFFSFQQEFERKFYNIKI